MLFQISLLKDLHKGSSRVSSLISPHTSYFTPHTKTRGCGTSFKMEQWNHFRGDQGSRNDQLRQLGCTLRSAAATCFLHVELLCSTSVSLPLAYEMSPLSFHLRWNKMWCPFFFISNLLPRFYNIMLKWLRHFFGKSILEGWHTFRYHWHPDFSIFKMLTKWQGLIFLIAWLTLSVIF